MIHSIQCNNLFQLIPPARQLIGIAAASFFPLAVIGEAVLPSQNRLTAVTSNPKIHMWAIATAIILVATQTGIVQLLGGVSGCVAAFHMVYSNSVSKIDRWAANGETLLGRILTYNEDINSLPATPQDYANIIWRFYQLLEDSTQSNTTCIELFDSRSRLYQYFARKAWIKELGVLEMHFETFVKLPNKNTRCEIQRIEPDKIQFRLFKS